MSFSEALVSSISKMVNDYDSKEIYVIDCLQLEMKASDSLEKLVKYVFEFYIEKEKIDKVVVYSTEKSNKFNLDIEYVRGYRHRRRVFKHYVNTNSPTKNTKPDEIILEIKKSDI